ncbi:MAG: L,D-transpeptidase [Bdellovibrionales bacterium]|nr:L,D-transpeptidase [Bdellovibrionales bacterium]
MKALLALIFTFFSTSALAQIKMTEGEPQVRNDGILLEANDAGEVFILPKSDLRIDVNYFQFKRSFEQVAQVITPEVEEAFDLFIFANVSYEKNGSPNDFITSQSMMVFKKPYSNQQIFNRDIQNQIIPYNPVSASALGASDHHPAIPGLPANIRISSGASHFGHKYVDTFSGVFRVNSSKSKTHRYQKGMYDALYVDIVYPSGKSSGIAIHGTDKDQYGKLGQQASHGCIRVHQMHSKILYSYVMSENLFDPELLDFGRTHRLPPGPLRDTRPGQRALMIFFYGYRGNSGLDI